MERIRRKALDNKENCIKEIKDILLQEAMKTDAEDVAINKAIGLHGSKLIKDNFTILTHCNAGALATSDYGTALGVVRIAHEQGKNIKVLADETRPYLQGARLTAWELQQDRYITAIFTEKGIVYPPFRENIEKLR